MSLKVEKVPRESRALEGIDFLLSAGREGRAAMEGKFKIDLTLKRPEAYNGKENS